MTSRRFLALVVVALLWSASASAGDNDPPPGARAAIGGGHFADGHGAWAPHPGWAAGGVDGMRHFNWAYRRGGHWWHGPYGGRVGWWWIVGPDWYWYPAEIYPYPDPFIPAAMASGVWYWCDAYQQYYPYVGACPSGWRAVPPQSL
jgi:hypothetical protein